MKSPRAAILASALGLIAVGTVVWVILSQPSPSAAIRIVSVSPPSGTIGTEVLICGSGFTSDNNDVAFAHEDIDFAGSNTAYVNRLTSPDGTTLRFELPDVLGACALSQMKPDEVCPAIGIPLPVGELTIAVVNANGTSNSVTFDRQKSAVELAAETLDRSPSFRELNRILNEITRRTGGATGLGINPCDGAVCISVWVEKDVPELSRQIPSEIEGFEVRIQEQ